MERFAAYAALDRPEILQFLFHPRKDYGEAPPPGAVDRMLPVAEGIRVGARFYPAQPREPHILFFHGNGEIAADYDSMGPVYNAYGMSFLVADYRGYGLSDGQPTVSAMMQDAHGVFQGVEKWLDAQGRTGPLVVMGRSLGSASALEVATVYHERLAGLIIESGYARTLPLLQRLGLEPVELGFEETDALSNEGKIGRFHKPTLIIHAEHDQIIPISHGEALFERCPAEQKTFHMVPRADHNTIFMVAGKTYFEVIRRFVDTLDRN